MKNALAYDKKRKLFRCDVGKPSWRFYLGGDAEIAGRRKVTLVNFWERSASVSGWTSRNVQIAKAIASGSSLKVAQAPGESDADYHERIAKLLDQAAGSITIEATATIEDYYLAQAASAKQRIEQLEARLREFAGPAAVEGLVVTVREAINEYIKHRSATLIEPDTKLPTEHSRTEANQLRFVSRLVGADERLTQLTFTRLHEWCSAVAARPLSQKTGKPISRKTVTNDLKVIRAFVKWAGRHYGWRRPDEWEEATSVRVRLTKEDRRAALAEISKHYSVEEIGELWRYALPSERMLVLLALNFGYTQAEILRMNAEDVAVPETAALRGKTGVLGRWLVWLETRTLAVNEFAGVPNSRQKIASRWLQLTVNIYLRTVLNSFAIGAASALRMPVATKQLCLRSPLGRTKRGMTPPAAGHGKRTSFLSTFATHRFTAKMASGFSSLRATSQA